MGELPASVDVVVVGGGQAGLSVSRLLSLAGREHVVLEARDRLGGGWLDRWESFCLVTPNWAVRMPGRFAYDGPDPDGFMPRDDVVRFLEAYAGSWDAPLELGTRVSRLSQAGDGFLVETPRGNVAAREVVVAAGGFQRPNIPPVAAGMSSRLHQLHSHAYRSPSALPPGGVLVVGAGQSGVQIAEELHEAGRDVFLSVGTAGSFPRRYRGRDVFWWMVQQGTIGAEFCLPPRTVDELPTPRARWAGNPALSGKRGGHDLEPIDLPIFDDMGYPRHRRGVTEVPGLYFLGLPWMHTQASATLLGVGLDAQHLVAQMEAAPVA